MSAKTEISALKTLNLRFCSIRRLDKAPGLNGGEMPAIELIDLLVDEWRRRAVRCQ